MEPSTVISLTGTFLKFVGETLADIKRRDLAALEEELLRLRRDSLSEKLEDFIGRVEILAMQEKARAEQDLISRGLANSTVRESTLRTIQRDFSNEVAKATREYNRAMEEIALLERKVAVQNRASWWKRMLFAP